MAQSIAQSVIFMSLFVLHGVAQMGTKEGVGGNNEFPVRKSAISAARWRDEQSVLFFELVCVPIRQSCPSPL